MKILFLGFLLSSVSFSLPYLKPNSIDVLKVIAPPPKSGSVEDKKDYETLFRYQETRSKKDCDRAQSEVHVNAKVFFGTLTNGLPPVQVQKLEEFIQKISEESRYFIQDAKVKFNRDRPYITNKDLKPCINKESSKAYPSGHASMSRLAALVLSKLYPNRTTEYLKRADEIALDRVIGGVHHPTDIEAGKKFADFLFNLLMSDEKFRKDLENLKS